MEAPKTYKEFLYKENTSSCQEEDRKETSEIKTEKLRGIPPSSKDGSSLELKRSGPPFEMKESRKNTLDMKTYPECKTRNDIGNKSCPSEHEFGGPKMKNKMNFGTEFTLFKPWFNGCSFSLKSSLKLNFIWLMQLNRNRNEGNHSQPFKKGETPLNLNTPQNHQIRLFFSELEFFPNPLMKSEKSYIEILGDGKDPSSQENEIKRRSEIKTNQKHSPSASKDTGGVSNLKGKTVDETNGVNLILSLHRLLEKWCVLLFQSKGVHKEQKRKGEQMTSSTMELEPESIGLNPSLFQSNEKGKKRKEDGRREKNKDKGRMEWQETTSTQSKGNK